MSQEFTFAQVAEHDKKDDLYVVIHDKVYDCTKFIHEHPGGEEVLLDVAGADSTEAFEDVGHSDEAREILDGILVGSLKRVAGDPKPHPPPPTKAMPGSNITTGDSGMGVGLYLIILIGAALAFGAYKVTQGKGAAPVVKA